MIEGLNLQALALPIFAILILCEVFWSGWRRLQAYAIEDFLGSMSQLAGNIIVQLIARGSILGFYYWLYQFRPITIGTDLLELALLAGAIDFVFYWYHRASHRIRFLWAIHVAHHSSEHMNFGTALRQSWFGPLSKPLFYWPLPLIGFDPLATMAVGAMLTIYGFWTHTEQIRRIGFLEHIFVSPAHHRVHHGSNDIYIDKNYANFLIVWDKLFGTFQDEVETVRYGLTRNLKSYNPFIIACHEWISLVRDLAAANSLGAMWTAVFGAPENSAEIQSSRSELGQHTSQSETKCDP